MDNAERVRVYLHMLRNVDIERRRHTDPDALADALDAILADARLVIRMRSALQWIRVRAPYEGEIWRLAAHGLDGPPTAAQPIADANERPPYPEGNVIGPCVCGSWPGGPCLRCKWIPADANERP